MRICDHYYLDFSGPIRAIAEVILPRISKRETKECETNKGVSLNIDFFVRIFLNQVLIASMHVFQTGHPCRMSCELQRSRPHLMGAWFRPVAVEDDGNQPN
jgi:hypothetical protein